MTTEGMQALALELLNKGYTPLRVERGQKAATSPGWQVDTPTPESLTRQFSRPSNMGVRTGDIRKDGTCLVGIDIDLPEIDLIRCVERAIGERVPTKKGRKGYTYFVRLDREQKTKKLHWKRGDKKTAAIDVLARSAQTVIPPSIHPDTNLPYEWVSAVRLDEVDYRTLPVFGPSLLDEIDGFCKNAKDPIYALNDMEWRGVGGGGNTHDVCLAAVGSMVARKWTDEDIHSRIQRAKREACEAAGMPYNWPDANKVIQEWIDSSREKNFGSKKAKIDSVSVEVLNRYVYVASINKFFDLQKGTMYEKVVFDNIHAREIPDAWNVVIAHPDCRVVDRITYSPGQPQFCKEPSFDSDAVLDCLNIYSGPGIEPEEGDVSPFVDLVKDVMDNNEEAYTHVFKFFAYATQHPGVRINHALVIQGEQGIGKDSIAVAISHVFGGHNTSKVTLQHVESAFNEWLFGKQLIVFDEMLAPGRRNIYNRLKNVVTDEVLSINIKNVNLQKIRNRAVYVFLTNYKHALSIDASDRRMWVWYSKMLPKSPAYYKRFYSWISDKRSSSYLMKFLLDYDTSDFDPSAPPPMTESKRELIGTSAPEVEQFLREAVESNTWPMACDLVIMPHLHGALRPLMKVSLSMLNEALDNILGTNPSHLTTRPRIGDQRPRMRCIRNFDKWQTASASDLSKSYLMPLPPQAGETEGSYSIWNGTPGTNTEPDQIGSGKSF